MLQISVATSDDANPDGKIEGSNESNANGLICPPRQDIYVFNSLPIKIQREVVEQHRSTEGLAVQLYPASCFDPEVISAIL